MKLKNIKLKNIVEFPIPLRGIDKDDPEFKLLVNSIRSYGVIEPIVVRPTFEKKYAVVSGLRRYKAAMIVGTKKIPCAVVKGTETDMLYFQLTLSKVIKEVKPIEYSRAIFRILARDKSVTMGQFCNVVNTTPKWLSERLGLNRLHKDVAAFVDTGVIKLSNAYVLAKLPMDEQTGYVDRAIAMDELKFAGTVIARYNEIREQRRVKRT